MDWIEVIYSVEEYVSVEDFNIAPSLHQRPGLLDGSSSHTQEESKSFLIVKIIIDGNRDSINKCC